MYTFEKLYSSVLCVFTCLLRDDLHERNRRTSSKQTGFLFPFLTRTVSHYHVLTLSYKVLHDAVKKKQRKVLSYTICCARDNAKEDGAQTLAVSRGFIIFAPFCRFRWSRVCPDVIVHASRQRHIGSAWWVWHLVVERRKRGVSWVLHALSWSCNTSSVSLAVVFYLTNKIAVTLSSIVRLFRRRIETPKSNDSLKKDRGIWNVYRNIYVPWICWR